MSEPSKAVFTLGEIRAFRYLAIIQGIVACGIILIADAPIFAIAFTTAVMVVVPFLVYALRRLRAESSDELNRPNKSPEPTPGTVTPRAEDPKSK